MLGFCVALLGIVCFCLSVSFMARAFLGRLFVAAASALCVLGLPCALPQHTSAASHAADRFFVKRSGGQAVRGSEARRSATLVGWLFVSHIGFVVCEVLRRWSALLTAGSVLGWRAVVADFAHSS